MGFRKQENVSRPKPVRVTVDKVEISAYEGESLAAALLAAGIHDFRRDSRGKPRAPFCNMGSCFECLVYMETSDEGGKSPDKNMDMPWVRGCLTPVVRGMKIYTATFMEGSDINEP